MFKSERKVGNTTLKTVMFIFVMLVLMGAVWADWASARPSNSYGYSAIELDLDPKIELMSTLGTMESKLEFFKEGNQQLIVSECVGDSFRTSQMVYCTMSQMYALQHIIRHYESFVDDLYSDARPPLDIATDFEVLNDYLEEFSRAIPNGLAFNFVDTLRKYERYLAGEEV
jgi:hypothetical protein